MTTQPTERRPRKEREGRRRNRGFAFADHIKPIVNKLPVMNMLDDEGVQKIHARRCGC